MVISDSVRLLFVHVQKTGGSTVDAALTEQIDDVRRIPELDRHAGLRRILAAEPALASYWTVGFVRNPWARMVSWHQMVLRMAQRAEEGYEPAVARMKHNPFVRGASTHLREFDAFVTEGPERFRRLRMPQLAYLTTRTRRADYIGRQETLEADLQAMRARLGLPQVEVVSRNVDQRPRPHYRDFYTDATRTRVGEIFAADIEAFGYTF